MKNKLNKIKTGSYTFKISLLVAGVFLLLGFYLLRNDGGSWVLVLKQPGKNDIEIQRFPKDVSKTYKFQKDVNGIHILVTLDPKKDYTAFRVTASTNGKASVFFTLNRKYTNEIPYNFNGEVKHDEIYRQSPHDVNAWTVKGIAEQPIPVVALKSASGYDVALNSSPAFYDNFTSQAFYTNKKVIALCSGDDGKTPGLNPNDPKYRITNYNVDKSQIMSPGKVLARYNLITSKKTHVFNGVIFKSDAVSLNGLRKDVNQRAAAYFSGGQVKDYFGSLAFTTAYMNLRVNETGKSKYWVVPSVEYSNTQYCRDAFWISMMLPKNMAGECLNNELQQVNTYAEYPLITILWAYRYRAEKANIHFDKSKVQAYVDSVEKRARNGYFYSYTEKDGRLDFQYWGDLIAFDKDDVITYNQGLFALALEAANRMGLHTKTSPSLALKNYQDMFNKKGGFFPISKKKRNITGPDPVVPDLLSIIYFNRSMLTDSSVKQHYQTIVSHLKTKYGFKVIANPNGNYLNSAEYNVAKYTAQANKENIVDGQYFRGGSYFLYDNLFLIDAYLHGIKGAEENLIWRVSLDFKAGGTTYECINTITGEPWKPNMGWNTAIYFIWRELIEQGKATDKLFKKIDVIAARYLKK